MGNALRINVLVIADCYSTIQYMAALENRGRIYTRYNIESIIDQWDKTRKPGGAKAFSPEFVGTLLKNRPGYYRVVIVDHPYGHLLPCIKEAGYDGILVFGDESPGKATGTSMEDLGARLEGLLNLRDTPEEDIHRG